MVKGKIGAADLKIDDTAKKQGRVIFWRLLQNRVENRLGLGRNLPARRLDHQRGQHQPVIDGCRAAFQRDHTGLCPGGCREIAEVRFVSHQQNPARKVIGAICHRFTQLFDKVQEFGRDIVR